MQDSTEFSGLPMPVFAAFGWAGEENALNYALGELGAFIEHLYQRLPPEIRRQYSGRGVNQAGQNVYLSTGLDVGDEAYLAFNARPMSFEVEMGLIDKEALAKGLAAVNSDLATLHGALAGLDPAWTLRIQQMELNKGTSERVHHSDLYKGSAAELSAEEAETLFARAAYLNGESGWVTPVFLSIRLPSERIAALGTAVIDTSAELVKTITPILTRLLGRRPRKARTADKATPASASVVEAEPTPTVSTNGESQKSAATIIDSAETFDYVASLQPLHIRRGFINLTSGHWPYFAQSTRTETRDVVVNFEGRQDTNSSVWRLQPDNQARIMLGQKAQQWLEENFSGSDQILVSANKAGKDEISLTLAPVD